MSHVFPGDSSDVRPYLLCRQGLVWLECQQQMQQSPPQRRSVPQRFMQSMMGALHAYASILERLCASNAVTVPPYGVPPTVLHVRTVHHSLRGMSLVACASHMVCSDY
jgi:hypothetical protein